MEKLLRRLIRERIRQETNKRFQWSEFLKLSGDIVALRRYADERLNELGASSRAAYLLTSHSVLKIAIMERGIKQNSFEIKAYERLKNLPVTKIFKHDSGPRPAWLVCELVNPIESDAQFKKITGKSSSDLAYDAEDKIGLDDPYVKMVRNFIDAGLDYDELAIPYQWGLNTNGELRLLDYGYGRTT